MELSWHLFSFLSFRLVSIVGGWIYGCLVGSILVYDNTLPHEHTNARRLLVLCSSPNTTVIFIPPPFLIFGAGYAFARACDGSVVWGVLAALFVCFVGSAIGAILAFFRARYMMRDLVELFARRYPLIRAADQGTDHKLSVGSVLFLFLLLYSLSCKRLPL